MRKLEKLQLVKNVSSNWVALVVNVLVGIFLSPFILHRLGDTAFGIWVLIFSITGYYGLFDLGIRSSVVRYVSKAKATGDPDYASRVISTSLFAYSCIGIVTFLITLTLTAHVDAFFRIEPEFHTTARWLLFMVGSAVSLGFPLGISGGMLEGLQRFDITSFTSIASALLRALLIVIALQHGHGLLVVAFITVILPILASTVAAMVAFRLLPIRLRWSRVDRETFREMAGYSAPMLIMIVSARLRFKSDSLSCSNHVLQYWLAHCGLCGRSGGEPGADLRSHGEPCLLAGRCGPVEKDFRCGESFLRVHNLSHLCDFDHSRALGD